jgi:hypothetical protein
VTLMPLADNQYRSMRHELITDSAGVTERRDILRDLKILTFEVLANMRLFDVP